MRPQRCRAECEPAVLVGARYRLLLHARHQAGHLWPGPGPLRACGLHQKPGRTAGHRAACPWGFLPRLQPPAPWMASKMVLSASPKILLRLIHKGKPGGPGASIQEQVLEVPAQKES